MLRHLRTRSCRPKDINQTRHPIGRHRQAVTRTQHPPMEIDEYHNERVCCTLVPEFDQIHEKDSLAAVSHNKTSQATDIEPQTRNTTRASRSNETRYNLRGDSKMYTDFVIHQISYAREALRPVNTRGEGTKTRISQQQTLSENIRDSEEAADCHQADTLPSCV